MEEDSGDEEEGVDGGGKSGKGKEREPESTGRGTGMKERRGAISRGQGVGGV